MKYLKAVMSVILSVKLFLHIFNDSEFNPYWQITETKSKTWEFTERHLRKQNPKNFQKFYFGNVTERHLWKQNPNQNTEYLVIIFIFLRFLGSSPSVNYGNKIQWNFT